MMNLLTWSTIALIISIIAGALGFSGLARGARTVSFVLSGIFLAIALVMFVMIALGIGIAL
ncbi:DUF1328 domain-containing protein [Egbenema bharatensis]|uniref:DUF1328 domain-containing protein n=1 Tax=Egbenema bharatensis TaxID=3463334 RepID=UPI003A85A526